VTRIAVLKQSCKAQGGLEKQTLALVKALLKEKIDVDFLVQGPCLLNLSDLEGLHLHILSQKRMGSLWSLFSYDRALLKHFEKHTYSASLGLERHSSQTHYRAGSGVHRYFLNERMKNAGFFKRISLQCNPFHQKILEMEAKTFGKEGAKRIYTNSHWVAHQIHDLYQTPWNRLCVIHNGVEWKAYEKDFNKIPLERKSFCNELGLDSNNRYLAFIGHGFERKGLDLALRWLHKSQNYFHLLVVGKDKNLEFFKRQAKQLGLGSRVHFLGQQARIQPILGLVERLILPTRYDPFANVTLEALAMGTDVWTSSCNGASEILPVTSFDFSLESEEAWLWAIEKSWQEPPVSFEEKRLVRQSVEFLELETQAEKIAKDILATI
jgi:UDP-glucose:(heptosyl)LPS alpha-1,3-glucosyltransferase